MRYIDYTDRHWRARLGASALAVALMAGVSGCDSFLQVSNPNNISGEDTETAQAALGLVNGTEALVSGGFSENMNNMATITDELEWVGSRDSYREHDEGFHTSPFNEFTDGFFSTMAQARWLSEETIRILTELGSEVSDADALMGRANLYKAMVFGYIADFYDTYPIDSDRTEGATPVGESAMGAVYDEGIMAAQTAVSLAQTAGDTDTETEALGVLARLQHARAVWDVVGDRGNLGYTQGDPSSGLANATAAAATAVTALSAMGGLGADYVYQHIYSNQTVGNSVANWVNSRQEMRFASTYTSPDPAGKPTFDQVILTDPIDAATVSPELVVLVNEFISDVNNAPMRVTSAREMQLIIAESELFTNGDAAGFRTAINALRTMDGLSDYTGQDIDLSGANDLEDAVALLAHSRQTNLFMYGRRLADMYRFSVLSPEWKANSTAITQPGSFLPLPAVECQTNQAVGGCGN